MPIISGLLIVASFLAPAGGWTDLLMVAAAVVAGWGIVVKAVRALTARVIGIDLLVSIAAIGAVVIGEYWEAAAVTFLFAVGHALAFHARLARVATAVTVVILEHYPALARHRRGLCLGGRGETQQQHGNSTQAHGGIPMAAMGSLCAMIVACSVARRMRGCLCSAAAGNGGQLRVAACAAPTLWCGASRAPTPQRPTCHSLKSPAPD